MEGAHRFEKVLNDLPEPSAEDVAIAEERQAEERAEREANELKNIEIAKLRDEAPARAKALLAERVPEMSPEELSTLPYREQMDRIQAKIKALTEIKDELDVMKEDSTEALDNKNRFLIEEIGYMIANEEASYKLLPSIDGIAERVNPELHHAIQAVLDRNREGKT